jgi:hypothetical protein
MGYGLLWLRSHHQFQKSRLQGEPLLNATLQTASELFHGIKRADQSSGFLQGRGVSLMMGMDLTEHTTEIIGYYSE